MNQITTDLNGGDTTDYDMDEDASDQPVDTPSRGEVEQMEENPEVLSSMSSLPQAQNIEPMTCCDPEMVMLILFRDYKKIAKKCIRKFICVLLATNVLTGTEIT